MNPAEALQIVHFVQEACPAQKFSEYTPDIWAELLADVNFPDARGAVVTLAKTITFIGPPDIIAEVRRIRAERLTRYGRNEPEYDGDDVAGGLEAIRGHNRRVAAGEITEPPKQLSGGPRADDVDKLVRNALRGIPTEPEVRTA